MVNIWIFYNWIWYKTIEDVTNSWLTYDEIAMLIDLLTNINNDMNW